MSNKVFGTDGIRGRTNEPPMTPDVVMRVAMAAALAVKEDRGGFNQHRVVIGKDTRLSGYMIEQAMAAGFEAMGMDVIFVGPMPTPAVAMLTRSLRADMGVMISASHNPYEDNGIKLFGHDGYKLSDALERTIEEKLAAPEGVRAHYVEPTKVGKANQLEDAAGRYSEFLKSTLPRRQTLEGLKVVVDCANGSGYKVAPQLLWELEADVVKIAARPDGRNINLKCGATAPEMLQGAVVAEGADVGIALDGDADRVIFVNELGEVVDGDQIMAVLAKDMFDDAVLIGDGLVATIMSNLGLERYLESEGMVLRRTPVGDRSVVEAMRNEGFNLGGEQSGHIILSDYATAGDGLLTALQVLSIIKRRGQKASEVLSVFEPLPQLLQNVRFAGPTPLETDEVKAAIEQAEKTLANDGRLVIRASGTEPVIRVMAEGDDQRLVKDVVQGLCDVIENVVKTA